MLNQLRRRGSLRGNSLHKEVWRKVFAEGTDANLMAEEQEEDREDEETAQPTLAEILGAVNKCIASVNTYKNTLVI